MATCKGVCDKCEKRKGGKPPKCVSVLLQQVVGMHYLK